MSLPLGFRFMPSNKELLGDYLKRKVLNQRLPWDVKEIDIYGRRSPWELFNEYDTEWQSNNNDDDLPSSSKPKKDHIYCFARLRKVSENGTKNCIRRGGCGQWHGQTGALHEIEEGSMKLFKFKPKPREGTLVLDEAATKYTWLMHEYSLSEKALAEMGVQGTDLVICKVTRVESKRDPKKIGNDVQGGSILGKRKYPGVYGGDASMGGLQQYPMIDFSANQQGDRMLNVEDSDLKKYVNFVEETLIAADVEDQLDLLEDNHPLKQSFNAYNKEFEDALKDNHPSEKPLMNAYLKESANLLEDNRLEEPLNGDLDMLEFANSLADLLEGNSSNDGYKVRYDSSYSIECI